MVHATLGSLLVATLGLNLRLEVPLAQALVTAFLVLTLPLLSLAQLPYLQGARLDRPGVYAGSAVTLVLLTTVALVVGALGPGLPALGLGAMASGDLLMATARLGGAAVVVLVAFHLTMRVARIDESPLLAELLPRTAHERRLFAGLALFAGFGEEVVFRGFLLAALTAPLGGVWLALLVSSLAFGVLHSYQGPVGMLRTACLGGVLGASVVLDGSLWPAIVAHVLIDLVGGLVVGPRTVPLAGHSEGT
jgi:membrane protease YdiL (CAAX protease family)